MLKAKVTFTEGGVTVKRGQEIKDDTFDGDVLLQSLLDAGFAEYIPDKAEPKERHSEKSEGSKKK